jgi:enoyl-CoA hydratase
MLDVTIEKGLASLVLNRPPANAINGEWLDQLDRFIAEMALRTDVAMVHVRSAQKVFCAGADLHLMSESLRSSKGVDTMMAVVGRMQRSFESLSRLPQVVLAEIRGAALGGGFELALACDLRIASENSVMGLPEARLGLLPGAGGTQRLTQLVGPGIAARLILGAEAIKGADAARLGLVQWTTSDELLEKHAADLALRIASLPPMALAACKRCISAALSDKVLGMQIEISGTRDLYESERTQILVREFIESRSARSSH